jgi:bacillithiol biosynthesis cysteine-adding enzyme BshC
MDFVDTPLGDSLATPALHPTPTAFALPEAVFPASIPAAGRLAQAGALAITTGQQPGLFTGPLYTFYKALSARAVAAELERRWGRPVVPVFWVAGDDHDFAEGSQAAWLGTDGSLVTSELPPREPGAPLTPLYREAIPEAARELLARFESTTPPGEGRDLTVAWLRRHYEPGTTLAAAFGGALAELVADLGVVCLDASSPGLKRLAWPTLRAALVGAGRLDALLAARSDELVARGRDPGVKVGDGATLVMLEGRAGRDRLLADGDGFVTRRSREHFTLAELERIAESEPRRLSANVLLRPVIESTVLPTVAYLAGPAELRYLELAGALFQPLGAARQSPMARWSGLLVEPRVTRTLEKLDLSLAEVLANGSLDDRLAQHAVPREFGRAAADLRAALTTGYDRVIAEIGTVDSTLEKPARSTMGQALGGLAELEKRVLQAAKRRQAEALGQLDRVRTALAPGGQPQERVLGLPGFLARYGRGLLDELVQHIDAWYRRALYARLPTP